MKASNCCAWTSFMWDLIVFSFSSFWYLGDTTQCNGHRPQAQKLPIECCHKLPSYEAHNEVARTDPRQISSPCLFFTIDLIIYLCLSTRSVYALELHQVWTYMRHVWLGLGLNFWQTIYVLPAYKDCERVCTFFRSSASSGSWASLSGEGFQGACRSWPPETLLNELSFAASTCHTYTITPFLIPILRLPDIHHSHLREILTLVLLLVYV